MKGNDGQHDRSPPTNESHVGGRYSGPWRTLPASWRRGISKSSTIWSGPRPAPSRVELGELTWWRKLEQEALLAHEFGVAGPLPSAGVVCQMGTRSRYSGIVSRSSTTAVPRVNWVRQVNEKQFCRIPASWIEGRRIPPEPCGSEKPYVCRDTED